MKIQLTIDGKNYQADLTQQQSIAITLNLNERQPSHFGAPRATSLTLESEKFIGDTQRGGSCNVNQLTLIPHCNGTHTESVSHIVNEPMAVFDAIPQALFPSVLISIKPLLASQIDEQYIPCFDAENLVITKAQLEKKLSFFSDEQLTGLVIRTIPNLTEKRQACYDENNYPVYLTNDAMQYLCSRKVQHLMVDFPSVDKMYDEGKLSNHRIFWQVEADKKSMNENTLKYKTITEMIFAADQLKDGFYLCNLQVSQIATDALPSRPILVPLESTNI